MLDGKYDLMYSVMLICNGSEPIFLDAWDRIDFVFNQFKIPSSYLLQLLGGQELLRQLKTQSV